MKFILLFAFLTPGAWSATLVDSHLHLKSPSMDGAAAIAQLDKAGVQKAVVLSAGYFRRDLASTEHENDFAAQEAAKFPDRLIPFCSVTVDAPWAIDEIERCKNQLNIHGLKLHLTQNGISLLTEEGRKPTARVLDKANELGMVVLIDFNKWDTNEFLYLLELMVDRPKAKFIIAHALFTNFRALGLLIALHLERPDLPRNIAIDISATLNVYSGSPEEASLLWHMRKIGLDRVFFGSDSPVTTVSDSLKALKAMGLTPEEFDAVGGESFLKFYGR